MFIFPLFITWDLLIFCIKQGRLHFWKKNTLMQNFALYEKYTPNNFFYENILLKVKNIHQMYWTLLQYAVSYAQHKTCEAFV